MIMRFNEIHKFSDGTLHQIDEALDYRFKKFKVNGMNQGLNTRFWTRKDVDRSKEFMFSIQKRLKTRRIFRNLESFVGGKSAPASDHLNQKALLSLEPRDHPKNLIRTLFHYACFVIHCENEDGNPTRANIKQVIGSDARLIFKSISHQSVGFNSLVHSLCALSTLRRSGLRTSSAAAKPCQGDSLELYLITGRIPTVAATGQRDVNSQPYAPTSNSLSKT
nr:hypothetical protein [Tanacetum cinerariifolium]